MPRQKLPNPEEMGRFVRDWSGRFGQRSVTDLSDPLQLKAAYQGWAAVQ